MSRQRSRGVTLMELMIVLVVVGIIAMVAIPSFRSSNLKTYRTQGQDCLLVAARKMESFYTRGQPPTYTTNLTSLGYGAASGVTCDGDKYRITASAVPTADVAACANDITRCFRITATPQNGQEDDGELRVTVVPSAADPSQRLSKQRRVNGTYTFWN